MKRHNVKDIPLVVPASFHEAKRVAEINVRIRELNRNGSDAQKAVYGKQILTARPEGMSMEQYREIRKTERDLLRSVTRR